MSKDEQINEKMAEMRAVNRTKQRERKEAKTKKTKELKSFALLEREAKNSRGLTVRQENYCRLMTAIGSDTYSRGGKSAKVAGYAQPDNASCKLLKKPQVQTRISELIAEHAKRNNLTADRVLSDLQHEKSAALEKGDIASAIAATRLMGLHLKMFSERMEFSVEDTRQLEESHREAARLVAARLLSEGILDAPVEPGQLPAPVVEQPSIEQPYKPEEKVDATMEEVLTGEAINGQPATKPKRFGPHTHEETQAELDSEVSQGSETGAVRNQVKRDSQSGGQSACVNE